MAGVAGADVAGAAAVGVVAGAATGLVEWPLVARTMIKISAARAPPVISSSLRARRCLRGGGWTLGGGSGGDCWDSGG